MVLYVARHGQTNYNDLFLCNADPRIDVHLTELGVTQSEELADKLKNISIDVIYISELRRTRQTAEIVNKLHNIKIIIDQRLNDNKTGFEGKPVELFFAALKNSKDSTNERFNDGESLQDVVSRVRSFLDDLKIHSYKSVLIVSSQIIVQYIDGIIKDVPDVASYELEVPKGSHIEFEIETL